MFDEYAFQLQPYSVFGHVCTERRFVEMIRQVGQHFGKSLPQSTQDNAQLQAFYHFFLLSGYNPCICF